MSADGLAGTTRCRGGSEKIGEPASTSRKSKIIKDIKLDDLRSPSAPRDISTGTNSLAGLLGASLSAPDQTVKAEVEASGK